MGCDLRQHRCATHLLNFAGHRASHLRHHAHTNTERDPDLGAKAAGCDPVKWFIGNIVLLLVALPRGVRLANALMARLGATKASEGGDDSLLAPQRWAIRLGIGAILVSIPFGALVPVVVLWVIPARLTFLYLAVFFVWLPHYPYEHTDRFRNTRITLFWLKLAPASAGPSPHPSPLPLNPVVPVPGCASRTRLASRRRGSVVAGPSSKPRQRVASLKHLGDACGRQPWVRRSQALTTSAALVVLRISSCD